MLGGHLSSGFPNSWMQFKGLDEAKRQTASAAEGTQ
jgi:hypothetical protein